MFWLTIILVPALFLCVCVGLSFFISHRQIQKAFISPVAFGLVYEDIQLRTSDSIRLSGWWIPAGSSNRTIIFLHGYGGTYDPDLQYVPAFHNKGFNALMFDFRAHGRSGGHYTTVGALERQDCLAAIDFALSRGSTAIGLMGFSMGGRVAILSAPERPQVKAVLSDGGPARLTTVVSVELMKKGLPHWLANVLAFMVELGMSIVSGINLFKQEPIRQAAGLLKIPVLFIHGDHDPYTRLDELESMVLASGPNTECWRIPEAGHRDSDQYRPEEYIQKVTAFFERWLLER